MSGLPTFLDNAHIVITRTQNGFAVQGAVGDPIEQAVTFVLWDDLAYYLATNFSVLPVV